VDEHVSEGLVKLALACRGAGPECTEKFRKII
jgi:hypothetical protein